MARKEFSVLTPQMFYILLVLKEPLYGNQIMEEVKALTNGEVIIGTGTLYALLPRFYEENYIRIIQEKRKDENLSNYGARRRTSQRGNCTYAKDGRALSGEIS